MTIAQRLLAIVLFAILPLANAQPQSARTPPVMRLLQRPGLPGKDAADALGLAICHAHAGASFAAMGRHTALSRRAHAQYRRGRAY